jgi:hypothetical protein
VAELYANVTVSHKMHGDRRFDLLAQLAGWSRPEACWRMVELWSRCTALQTDRPPAVEIRVHLGLRGEELLLAAALAERCTDGAIRVLGGGLSGGDTDRFGWYGPLENRNAAGGRARAAGAPRVGGRFVAGGKPTSNPASVTSNPASVVTSNSSNTTSATSEPPASGIRISEEDQSSLPRAIPAVPEPDATPPTQPAPAPPTAIPPGESAWHRRQRWWGAMLEADQRIRAAGIEPKAPGLPKAPAGVNEQNMNRCERQLLDGGATPDEIDGKMRHIVLVAEAEALRGDNRSRKWFKPALIWDPERAARAADTSLAEAGRARTPSPRRGDPLPPAPPPKRPDPPPPDRPLSPEDRAEILALADRLVVNPDAAAAAELASGRVPAHIPTAELLKRFGDGQRAPPDTPDAIADEPRKQPKSRKAAT